nr:complex i intermediate-associated protein 30, mitochondrial [Quercus suber]
MDHTYLKGYLSNFSFTCEVISTTSYPPPDFTMFASPALRTSGGMPNFFRRSLDEFKRQAQMAVKMEGLHTPRKVFPIVHFDSEPSLQKVKVMCDDRMLGGFSRASLTFVNGGAHIERKPGEMDSEGDGDPSHALFEGKISTELPPNRPDVQRSGFAAWRTRDRGYSLFGKMLYNIDPYAYLALRIKSDGRKYFLNIQTESIVPTDIHQHLLPCNTPGEWETVTIPFSAFVRTNYGMVVEPQKEMLRQKVRSVGIGLTDRVPGPFELRIADVYATNTEALANQAAKSDTGFDLWDEKVEGESSGMFDEVPSEKKPGEPEKILI